MFTIYGPGDIRCNAKGHNVHGDINNIVVWNSCPICVQEAAAEEKRKKQDQEEKAKKSKSSKDPTGNK